MLFVLLLCSGGTLSAQSEPLWKVVLGDEYAQATEIWQWVMKDEYAREYCGHEYRDPGCRFFDLGGRGTLRTYWENEHLAELCEIDGKPHADCMRLMQARQSFNDLLNSIHGRFNALSEVTEGQARRGHGNVAPIRIVVADIEGMLDGLNEAVARLAGLSKQFEANAETLLRDGRIPKVKSRQFEDLWRSQAAIQNQPTDLRRKLDSFKRLQGTGIPSREAIDTLR